MTSFIWMFYECFFCFHVWCRMHGEAPVQVPADIPLYPSSIRLWWQQWLRWLVRWTLLRLAIFCLIIRYDEKGKGSHTRLPSVGFRSWARFLAVRLQVTWVINPASGCHYFPPGLQLPPQPLRGLLPILQFLLLGEERHNGCEQFA